MAVPSNLQQVLQSLGQAVSTFAASIQQIGAMGGTQGQQGGQTGQSGTPQHAGWTAYAQQNAQAPIKRHYSPGVNMLREMFPGWAHAYDTFNPVQQPPPLPPQPPPLPKQNNQQPPPLPPATPKQKPQATQPQQPRGNTLFGKPAAPQPIVYPAGNRGGPLFGVHQPTLPKQAQQAASTVTPVTVARTIPSVATPTPARAVPSVAIPTPTPARAVPSVAIPTPTPAKATPPASVVTPPKPADPRHNPELDDLFAQPMPAKSTAPPLTAAELRRNPDLDDLFGEKSEPPKKDRGNDLFGKTPQPLSRGTMVRDNGPLLAQPAPALSAIPSPEAYGPGQTDTGTGEFAAAVKEFVDAVKDMKEMNQGGKRGGDAPGPQAGGGFVPGGPQPGGGFSEHTPEPRTTPRASTGGMGPWMAAVTRSMGS